MNKKPKGPFTLAENFSPDFQRNFLLLIDVIEWIYMTSDLSISFLA